MRRLESIGKRLGNSYAVRGGILFLKMLKFITFPEDKWTVVTTTFTLKGVSIAQSAVKDPMVNHTKRNKERK
jgi:hypothetical protein